MFWVYSICSRYQKCLYDSSGLLSSGICMNREEFLKREQEVRQAVREYPKDDMQEAYRKWKGVRGEKPTLLQSADESIKAIKMEIKQSATKPCTQAGCSGTMELEAVCGGCVEGRLGYKCKWTCSTCAHRELSKKDFYETLQEVVSEGNTGIQSA